MKLVVREMIMVIIFKRSFAVFFFYDGFDFSAELDKPIDFERSFTCDFSFVCANQQTYSHANNKRVGCMF